MQLESDNEAGQGFLLGEDQTLTTQIPFSLTRDGGFYAKMLVTPWNPVNDNVPNGTVDGDGWWVEFFYLNDAGELLERDANGLAVEAEQGGRTDSTPTDVIPLPANTPYRLGVTVHMPADAADVDAYYDIPVALVFRDLDEDTATASGAGLEQSKGFRVIIDWDAPLSAIASPGAKPKPTDPFQQPPTTAPTQPSGPDNPVGFLPSSSLWIWVLLGVLLIAFMVRREYQLHRLRKDMESVLVGLEISGFFDYAASKAGQKPLVEADITPAGTPPADIEPTPVRSKGKS